VLARTDTRRAVDIVLGFLTADSWLMEHSCKLRTPAIP
jgi:hypothetical protein